MAPIDADLTISQLTEALLLKLREGTHVVDTKSQCISESELVNMESRLHEITSLSKTIRNSLRPINKLSPEVLAIIFSMVLPHIPSIRPTFKISFKHWVFISHVCRYWRATALSFASLWCSMDIRGNCDNDLASMFLQRSSSAPLKVYYYPCGMDEDDEELLSMFRDEAQASRLKELHMWTPYMHGVPEKMWELCQSPAPILESLTVSLNAYDVNGVALPRLFEGYTPRLRHLTLRHYSTWPHNTFENLTHVSLHAQPLMSRYPVREFLEFLGRSPLLEELVLIEAGPDMDSVISDDNRSFVDPVSLSRLRNIEIGGWESAEMVTTFLSYLVVPGDAVKLIWGQWTPSDNGLSLLFEPSSRLSADLRSIQKITISVVSSEQTAVHITPTHLHISGPYSPNLYGAESLVNVQELHLLTIRAARYSADECRAVFRCLPSLKTLVLSASFDLLSAFSPLGLEMDQVPLCPKLESIWVCTNGEGASLLLLILAHQRAKHGMPIRHLKIPIPIAGGGGGGGREEDVNENVERLKSVVEDVQLQVMDIRPSPVKPVAGSWRW